MLPILASEERIKCQIFVLDKLTEDLIGTPLETREQIQSMVHNLDYGAFILFIFCFSWLVAPEMFGSGWEVQNASQVGDCQDGRRR